MRYDERQVHNIVNELRAKLGAQEEATILADPRVRALRAKYDRLRARQTALEAEEKPLRKACAELGIAVSTSEKEFSVKKDYREPIPAVAAKRPRVKTFAMLDRKLRTAMVGGDRTEIRAALEALIAHVDSE
jgi:multidrug efflux pump subunit AcrA (membrane-fusion protein)